MARGWAGPSPRRWDGWEPQEVHEYRDRAGEPCRMAHAWFTVVTRESEWDPVSRARAMRLAEHDVSLCPTHHIPLALCREQRHDLVVDEVVDHTTRMLERHKAARRAQHEASNPAKGGLAWDTGVEFRVRQHDPRRDKPIPEPRPRRGRSARDDQVDHGPPEG